MKETGVHKTDKSSPRLNRKLCQNNSRTWF